MDIRISRLVHLELIEAELRAVQLRNALGLGPDDPLRVDLAAMASAQLELELIGWTEARAQFPMIVGDAT